MQTTLDHHLNKKGKKRSRNDNAPFHGQTPCEGIVKKSGAKCTNQAYYEQNGKYLCGVHSSTKKQRTTLKVDPQKKEKRALELAFWESEVEEAAMVHRANGKRGYVKIAKLLMMKAAPHTAGCRNVFPNYRHGDRVDGYGCKTLSPKDLGPVEHEMLGWPDAKNLENYHQGAKIFLNEVEKRDSHDNDPNNYYKYVIKPDAIALRKKMYLDPIPYRHKFDYPEMKKMVMDKKNLNKPLFSLFYHQTKAGATRRFSYLECRYFYCHFYEVLTRMNEELDNLREMIKQGYNLCLTGYDGREIKKLSASENLQDCLYRYYQDDSKPYGHELVLYTLLVLCNPMDYPWNRFRQDHLGLYDGFID